MFFEEQLVNRSSTEQINHHRSVSQVSSPRNQGEEEQAAGIDLERARAHVKCEVQKLIKSKRLVRKALSEIVYAMTF
jgi:hypothetical protein